MLQKVTIRIESIIDNLDENGLIDGESEKSVVTVDGIYRKSGSDAHISYKENGEGGASESEVLISGDSVTVRRRGAICSELFFREGESHSSVYSIPPFRFDAEVYTKRVNIELDENGGQIKLVYNMKIGGADKAAVMKIWISKASRQA